MNEAFYIWEDTSCAIKVAEERPLSTPILSLYKIRPSLPDVYEYPDQKFF